MYDDDEDRDAPGVVTAAVAAGTSPLPFLAVYATMFIVHGGFHHVVPPDVTGSNRGELVVGVVCLVLLIAGAVSLIWMLNASRRWPFMIMQAIFLGVAIDFLLDDTKSGSLISGFVMVTSVVALVLALHPHTWSYLRRRPPAFLTRGFRRQPAARPSMPAGSMPTADVTPTSSRLLGRRRTGR